MELMYVAGPYSAPTPEAIAANVAAAAAVGQECMRRGWAVICPHSMTHCWDIGTGLVADDFYASDLEILDRCDAIAMVGKWQASTGSALEWQRAHERGLQVFENVSEVPWL